MKPKLIAFSGIDGSGKSTYIESIERELKADGYNVVCLNPMITSLSKRFSEIIELVHTNNEPTNKDKEIDSQLLSFTYFWGLLEHRRENYLGYDYILCHRHLLSFLTYTKLFNQSTKLCDILIDYIEKPDITFFLDLDINIAYNRLINRSTSLKTKESLSNLKKAREIALDIINSNIIKVEKIDAEIDLEKANNNVKYIKNVILNQ